jgi:hypothetical protein
MCPAPSLTYTLTNGSTADASQVMQNFNDLLNGISDGTKDLAISAITCAGNATFNGTTTTIGNATSDSLVVTARVGSHLIPSADTTYDLGASTLGWSSLYLGDGDAETARVVSAAHVASRTYTIPDIGADANFVMTGLAQTVGGVKTFSEGIKFDDAGGQSTCNYFVEGSWPVSPVVEGSSTSGTGTSATGVGRYTRIGNTVFFTAYVTYTTHTGTGNLQIGDLPFTPAASAFYGVSVYTDRINTTAGIGMSALIGNSSTKIRLYSLRDDDTPLDITMADNSDAQTHAIAVSGWYQV